MTEMKCQRCVQPRKGGDSCPSCGLVFADYEHNKQQRIGEVYALMNEGDLEGAKKLAEQSGKDFPDTRGEFALLLSNINRDISIVFKFEQARRAFDQGDYPQVLLLLRNIKAFDQILDGKVISLRRKAERYSEHNHVFEEAVGAFRAGQLGKALELFGKIEGRSRESEVAEYLAQIDRLKGGLLKEAVKLLKNNQFELAGAKLKELLSIGPELADQVTPYLAMVEQKVKIRESLITCATRAREQGRFTEAKVLYAYLAWQWPDLSGRFEPYAQEIGARAQVNLSDAEQQGLVDCEKNGLKLDANGFCILDGSEGAPRQNVKKISVCVVNPEPLCDAPVQPVDIDGESVADFT